MKGGGVRQRLLVMMVAMMGPCEGFMEWLSWDTTQQDLCKGLCQCPEDLVLATQQGIDCVNCNITYIQEGLDIPKVFPSISFSRNHIQTLSPNTFKPSSTLISLDISNNDLQSLPGRVFEPLQVLSILILNNNNIFTVDPEAFAGLQNLTQLDLSYNSIQRLPKEVFRDLQSLEDLNLGFNPMGMLNESLLEHTPNLKTLDLSKLGLESIPASLFMTNLTKLERVSLAYNQLRVVPSKTLNTLRSSLLHLDLSGNAFTSLGAYSLYGLDKLRTLTLEQMMKLRTIDAYAFGDLTRLETLVMRYMPWIESIDPKAFHGTQNGKELALAIADFTFSFSSLRTLPEDLLPWDRLRYLSLEFNHWLCDCNMRWVKNSTDIIRMTGKKIMCLEPERLRGYRFIHVPDKDLTCDDPEPSTRGAFGFLVVVMIAGLSASLATVSLLVYWQRGWVCRRPPAGGYRTIQRNGSTITITDDINTASEA